MRLTPRRKPTIIYNRSVIPLHQVFHLQHLDACGTHCVTTAFLRYLFVYNAHCRCGLMCGTADAFKESVSAHHAARNRAAAAAPLPPHGAVGPSAAAVEECLFGEGAGSERWLHEYISPHPYHIPCIRDVSRKVCCQCRAAPVILVRGLLCRRCVWCCYWIQTNTVHHLHWHNTRATFAAGTMCSTECTRFS